MLDISSTMTRNASTISDGESTGKRKDSIQVEKIAGGSLILPDTGKAARDQKAI